LTVIRSDVLVLGSTLGSLVAGSYLARSGLRVVLFEEEVHAKRPPVMREPFLLSGLEPKAPISDVLRELGIPLIERRQLVPDALAYQVILPNGARIDVGGGRAALAADLAAYGVADADTAESWFEEVDALGDAARAQLAQAPRSAPQTGLTSRLVGPRMEEHRGLPLLPEPPPGLEALVRAQLQATSSVVNAGVAPGAPLLIRGARHGAPRLPHAGRGLLDLFRRRFSSFHGETHPVGAFELAVDGREVGILLEKGRYFGRALLIGVPLEPLYRFVSEQGTAPRWIRGGTPPLRLPLTLMRTESSALPIGMGSRVIWAASDAPGDAWSLSRHPDPNDPQTEWLVLSGAGADRADSQGALGALAPFSSKRLVPVDPGPAPRWDLDAIELRFPRGASSSVVRRRPHVSLVGAELAPELGFEGEILLARQTALRLRQLLS
jgi:hypothetical protein